MVKKEVCTDSGVAIPKAENGSGEPFPIICNNPNPCPGNQNYIPPNNKERQLGVHCHPIDQQPITIECIDKPSIIPDMTKPIFCNWPQDPVPPTPPRINRPDPLSQIPDQIVPQVVEVLDPGDCEFMKPTLNHPLCPDAQFTLGITPQKPKEVQIKMPEFEIGVRPPQRAWRQCVENQSISDQVRRPLARTCHKRQVPPIVIPFQQLEMLKLQISAAQRENIDLEERRQNHECEKLKSRYRHSLWNHTTESLLKRKRKKEAKRLQDEADETKQLLAEVKAEKDKYSDDWNARAKKLMLYRKGLIRDFHAAMANSKMLKDIEDAKNPSKGCDGEDETSKVPFLNKTCMKKMMAVNNRPEYKKKEKVIRSNPGLLEAIQRDEKRVVERKQEIEKELCEAQELMNTCPPELPEAYKKYIAEPICDENAKEKRQLKLREELYSEIHDKLAFDAFIEAHENEIDRQACEYNQYKRKVDYMKKQKEKQLIDEKVAHNIRMSEKAGEVLVQMKKKQQERSGEYDKLKDQWEAEFAEKEATKKEEKEKRLEAIYGDFWSRRNEELCKRQLLDPSRQWARERLVAVENYQLECDRKSERRKKAEEIAFFQIAQAEDKKCRELKEKRVNDIWGCKLKREYEDEMNEMKSYARTCIQDWEAKGRPVRGMHQSMKKWDYDAGMYPFADPIVNLENKNIANKMKTINCPNFETTANRLGFDRGSK